MLLFDKPIQLNRQKMKLETIEELKQEINSYEMVALLKACYNYFDIEIENPQVVVKSYPSFWEDLALI